MEYKDWHIKVESVHINIGQIRTFKLVASHYREILTPELEKPIPFLGRMTRREVLPLKLDLRCNSLRLGLIEMKKWIDEVGPVQWFVYNDRWAKKEC